MSFPQDEILSGLFDRPMTVRELREATGRAETTIRNNLTVMGPRKPFGGPWVERLDRGKWRLTPKGREIARMRRARMRRARMRRDTTV